MSRQPAADRSAEQSTPSASAGIARPYLFELDVDRQRRIDQYIDYFGGGGARRPVATAAPGRQSLLDSDGAR